MSKFISVFALLFTFSALSANELPKTDDFIVYDFPRSGIYTLDSSLILLTGKRLQFFPGNPVKSVEECARRIAGLNANHQYESAHWFWSYESAKWRHDLDCKIFFNIRDPRDVLIGFLHFIQAGNTIGHLSRDGWFGELTEDEQISILIKHLHDSGISKQIRDRLGWIHMPNTMTVKFENLIGPQGGGTHQDQVRELKRIASHINLEISDAKINEIANRTYDYTPPILQMGSIGMWESYFNEHHKLLFKQELGDVLIQLGYEKDLYW